VRIPLAADAKLVDADPQKLLILLAEEAREV
jgi:hypothetical protein